jgi:ribosomal protein S6--L-glutamate ligase
MRIGVLIFSLPKDELSAGAERLLEAAAQRDHELTRIYEPYLSFVETNKGIGVFYENLPLPNFDVIIPRPNFIEEPSLHTVTTDLLVRAGYRVLNKQPTFSLSKNKLAQHARLTAAGIAMPRWAIARTPEAAWDAAQKIGLPIVIKTAFGTWGKGVFYADSSETFHPIVDYLNVRDGNPVIVEKFVAEANRKDLRVIVIGGKIIAAMERTAREGDIRANASIGGVGSKVALSEEEKQIAIAATASLELDIAGVDILRSNRGPLVIEVNSNPGLKEIERASGVDVAGAIIEFATN